MHLEQALIEAATTQGIWVLLFVSLFMYTIKNNEKLKFSKLSEESFERLKEFYLSENANINEKKYWEETGMITCESLDKIIYERRWRKCQI